MWPDKLIHERRLPGGVIEQQLLASDAPKYTGFPKNDRRIRQTLENLRWSGTISIRFNSKPARAWRRYIMVVAP